MFHCHKSAVLHPSVEEILLHRPLLAHANTLQKKSLQFRRSVYAISDIRKGERLSKKNIKVIRPGFGVQPIYFEKLMNKKSPFNIKSETPLKKLLLKKLKISI